MTKPEKDEDVVYLVYTDVVGSTKLDKKDPIEWRKKSFGEQLDSLLSLENSLVLKSVGDALFVIYEGKDRGLSEQELIKKILYSVWKSFNTADDQARIRAVVHEIKGHQRGAKIAKYLSKQYTKGHKDNFLEALEKDIFGKEVNKAARILSLVHKPAILVSENVARKITPSAEECATKGNPIPFSLNDQDFVLHSPVPVLYMKGVFDFLEDKDKKPCVVWELGTNPTPTLASEFKSIQAFRLMTVQLKNATELSEKGNQIATEVLEELSLNSPDIKLRFYIDMLWNVIDTFVFQDISFERKDREIDKNNFLKSLNLLISKGQNCNGGLQIGGQAGKLDIIANKDCIKQSIYDEKEIPHKDNATSLLAFTSFPDIQHEARIRELLSRESLGAQASTRLITRIIPQSIELYESVKWSETFLSTNNITDESSSDFKGFSE